MHNLYKVVWCVVSLQINLVLSSSTHVTAYNETHTNLSLTFPSVLERICLLQPDVGPCRGDIPMYYYKPESRSCEKFFWGGCQGNGNRFDSESDCKSTCLSKPNPRKRRPKWCSLRFDYGYCFGAVPRWYYDSFWKVCKKVIYSGCGGNKNNFYQKMQCDAICRLAVGPLSNKTEESDEYKHCNNATKNDVILNG